MPLGGFFDPTHSFSFVPNLSMAFSAVFLNAEMRLNIITQWCVAVTHIRIVPWWAASGFLLGIALITKHMCFKCKFGENQMMSPHGQRDESIPQAQPVSCCISELTLSTDSDPSFVFFRDVILCDFDSILKRTEWECRERDEMWK